MQLKLPPPQSLTTAPSSADDELALALKFELLGASAADLEESAAKQLISDKTSGSEPTARELIWLMQFVERNGNESLAQQCLEKARRLTLTTAIDADTRIQRLSEIADLSSDLGDFGFTEQTLAEAKKFESAASPVSVSFISISLARSALARSDYNEALNRAQAALACLNSVSSHEWPNVLVQLKALSLAAQAAALVAQQSSDRKALSQAIDYADQSLKLANQPYFQSSPKLVAALLQKGVLDIAAQQYDEAQQLLSRALQVTASSPNEESKMLNAEAHSDMAQLYEATNKLDEAKQELASAIDLHTADSEPAAKIKLCDELDRTAALLLRQASTLPSAEKYPLEQAAYVRILDAAELIDKHIRSGFSNLPFQEQCIFAAKAQEQISWLVACAKAQAAGSNNSVKIESVYTYLVRWKGLLVGSLQRDSLAATLKDPQAKKLLEQLRLQERNLDECSGHPDWTEKINSIKKQLNAARESVVARFGFDPTDQDSGAKFKSNEFSCLLGADQTLIDINEYSPIDNPSERRYAAFVVSRSTPARLIDFGPVSMIDAAVESWLACASAPSSEAASLPAKRSIGTADHATTTESESSALAKLAKVLWIPMTIAPGTTKTSVVQKHIFICADGKLARLPFNIFLTDNSGSNSVCALDSPRELLRQTKAAEQASPPSNNMLLVGDVDFGTANVPKLPATKIEVEEVAKTANACGLKTETLTGTKPTKECLLTELPTVSYAHFATHGFYSGANDKDDDTDMVGNSRALTKALIGSPAANNPLAHSGILVAKSDNANGELSSLELVGLDLHKCKLVTLSACQSGRGDLISGQGVIGIRSAIIGAGAQSILMSLWPVDDDATRALMQEFYKNIFDKKEDEADALRDAQNTIKQDPKWSSPYYWAPWVLAGKGWQEK
jgi:CHAT domain-containing protein/tetratricopeptide (TPR) repeat protein